MGRQKMEATKMMANRVVIMVSDNAVMLAQIIGTTVENALWIALYALILFGLYKVIKSIIKTD
jgi:hypothetical protein